MLTDVGDDGVGEPGAGAGGRADGGLPEEFLALESGVVGDGKFDEGLGLEVGLAAVQEEGAGDDLVEAAEAAEDGGEVGGGSEGALGRTGSENEEDGEAGEDGLHVQLEVLVGAEDEDAVLLGVQDGHPVGGLALELGLDDFEAHEGGLEVGEAQLDPQVGAVGLAAGEVGAHEDAVDPGDVAGNIRGVHRGGEDGPSVAPVVEGEEQVGVLDLGGEGGSKGPAVGVDGEADQVGCARDLVAGAVGGVGVADEGPDVGSGGNFVDQEAGRAGLDILDIPLGVIGDGAPRDVADGPVIGEGLVGPVGDPMAPLSGAVVDGAVLGLGDVGGAGFEALGLLAGGLHDQGLGDEELGVAVGTDPDEVARFYGDRLGSSRHEDDQFGIGAGAVVPDCPVDLLGVAGSLVGGFDEAAGVVPTLEVGLGLVVLGELSVLVPVPQHGGHGRDGEEAESGRTARGRSDRPDVELTNDREVPGGAVQGLGVEATGVQHGVLGT